MKNSNLKKSPLQIGMIAALTLIALSQAAHAQSTTSANRGSRSEASVNDPWSDSIVDTLTEQQMIAVQNFADGNTLQAIAQYKDGLEQVLSTASTADNRLSWTYRMTERSLELANRVQSQVDATNEKEIRAVTIVLDSAYRQIVDNYYQLDAQFYTPYRSYCAGRRRHTNYDVRDFEDALRRYSMLQIQWFQKSFVMTVEDGGVVPRYNGKIFLIVLSSIAKGLATDLSIQANDRNPNLFPLAYAQAARSLAKLSDRIEQHLAGNSIFGNDQRAVNASYTNLLQIISYINQQ